MIICFLCSAPLCLSYKPVSSEAFFVRWWIVIVRLTPYHDVIKTMIAL